MKKKVLLLIDQKGRDFYSVKFIGEYLKEFGAKVYYCSKHNMLSNCLKYKPDVFVMSCSEAGYKDLAKEIAPWCKIVLMTQEGACATKESTILRHTLKGTGEEVYIQGLSRVYLWSEMSKQWLLEDKVYPEEIIRVFGTSRLDPYRLFTANQKNEGQLKLGFAGRGFAINAPDHHNPIQLLDAVRRHEGSHRAYIDDKREWEDWIWHNLASMRTTLNLLEQFSSLPKTSIDFRPDPYEKHDSYQFLLQKYANFSINSDPLLASFLGSVDVLLTEFSTTGLEMLLLNKPVISFQKLIGQRLADHNSKPNHLCPEQNKYYWQPETFDELFNLLEKCRRGELAFSPDPEGAKAYLSRLYDFDVSNSSSAFRIAQDIYELSNAPVSQKLAELHREEFIRHPQILRWKKKLGFAAFLVHLIFMQVWIFDLKHLYGSFKLGLLSSSLRKDYFWWNFRDSNSAKKFFLELMNIDKKHTKNLQNSTLANSSFSPASSESKSV